MAHITSELVLDGWAHRLGLELAADPPEVCTINDTDYGKSDHAVGG